MAPDPDETKRRSRGPWPLRTEQTTTPAGTHDHGFGLPNWIKPALIGCGVAILALVVAVVYLMLYILGKGQQRERQIADTREQVREQLCDVLDGLPQGGVLDLTRDKLGCGPGLPLSSFSPEVQRDLSPSAPPVSNVPGTPAPSAAPEPPPAAAPAPVQPPEPESPEPLPGGVESGTPAPAEPPPLSPPSQVRQLVCDLLPVCTEGTP